MQRATQEDSNTSPVLTCTTSRPALLRLATMFPSGFYLDAFEGEPLSSVLLRLPGFSADYIEGRIQTLFFNGDAIDDLGLLLTGATATIALSAALPGLAGAILRKNSPHAALRKTQTEHRPARAGSPVLVRVKLFNAVAIERGPDLCRNGVRINATDLASFLALRPSLLADLRDIELDGEGVAAETLPARLASPTIITLRVNC